jgi:hypothetical protein
MSYPAADRARTHNMRTAILSTRARETQDITLGCEHEGIIEIIYHLSRMESFTMRMYTCAYATLACVGTRVC